MICSIIYKFIYLPINRSQTDVHKNSQNYIIPHKTTKPLFMYNIIVYITCLCSIHQCPLFLIGGISPQWHSGGRNPCPEGLQLARTAGGPVPWKVGHCVCQLVSLVARSFCVDICSCVVIIHLSYDWWF